MSFKHSTTIDAASKKFKVIAPTIKYCKEYGIILHSHATRLSKRGIVIQHLFWVKSSSDAHPEVWTHEELKGLLSQYKHFSGVNKTT
jgi:hypothetical protein